MSYSRRMVVVVSSFIVAGVLAPVSYSRAAGISDSAAACATCCPQTGSTCVVCGTKSCSTNDNAYQARVGSPCSDQT